LKVLQVFGRPFVILKKESKNDNIVLHEPLDKVKYYSEKAGNRKVRKHPIKKGAAFIDNSLFSLLNSNIINR